VLSQLLRRIDGAMFNALLRAPEGWAKAAPGGGFADADPITCRAALPGGGEASFGAAQSVKLLLDRLCSWAAKRKVADAAACFPLLRAAANVLMVPKPTLEAASERAAVSAPLSPLLLRLLLLRFSPDADCPDAVPPALIAQLEAEAKAEARRAAAAGGKEAKRAAKLALAPAGGAPYAPPDAASLGLAWLDADGFPLDGEGLARSEEPMGALPGGAGAPCAGAEADCRFAELRRVWAV